MEKVKAILESRTLEELVKDFEATETTNDINIYQVRGWLMDEIQKGEIRSWLKNIPLAQAKHDLEEIEPIDTDTVAI